MNAHQMATLIEACIPVAAGSLLILKFNRDSGKPPLGVGPSRYGRAAKAAGPVLVFVGILQLVIGLAGPSSVPVRPLGESPLYPLRSGSAWVYRCGENEAVIRVVAHDVLNGTKVARLELSQEGRVLRRTALRVDGDVVVKAAFEDKLFMPVFPLVALGPPRTWEYRSSNGKLVYQAEQSDGGAITTPSGTYPRSTRVLLKGSDASGPSEVETWYVEGIGPVKERASAPAGEVILELRSVSLPPTP